MKKFTQQEIEKKVIEVLSDYNYGVIDNNKINSETTVQDLCLDSLDMAELEIEFEDTFGIPLKEGFMDNVSNVGDIVCFINNAINPMQK